MIIARFTAARAAMSGLALAAVCLVGAAASCTASAGEPMKYSRTEVFPERGWQDSGISVKRGQYYRVEARGSWISGYKHPAHGPEGEGSGTLKDGPLVGWISPNRPERLGYESYTREVINHVIYLGEGGLFKAYGDGRLWLAMGEWSGCEECSGRIEVLINLYD
jgi:hypothetical protein